MMTDDETLELTSVSDTATFFDFIAWIEEKIEYRGYKGVVAVINTKGRYVNIFFHLTLKGKPIRQYEMTIPFEMSSEKIDSIVGDVFFIPSAVRERLRYIKEKRNETQG